STLFSQFLQFDREQGNALSDVVMQFACDAPAFGLLRQEQLAAEVRGKLFGTLQLRHVDSRSDITKEAAIAGEPADAGIEDVRELAVVSPKAILDLQRSASQARELHRAMDSLEIVGMDTTEPARGVVLQRR